MGNQLKQVVFASDLAGRLGLEWHGKDAAISRICPLAGFADGGLCFSKSELDSPLSAAGAVIAPGGDAGGASCLLRSTHPRLDFARALRLLADGPGFSGYAGEPKIHSTARIGQHVVIGVGVVIGANTVIHHNVVIGDGVRIGERCVIKSGTVIGEDGFGFERDTEGLPMRMMHLGSVEIGNDVELGSLNTICRGTLGDTVVESDVKTDDHVHIAHNCILRRGALLAACAELSGGVDIGAFSWIGPNASIIQKVRIGERAFVGIAANVTKSVESGVSVVGNPARSLPRKS